MKRPDTAELRAAVRRGAAPDWRDIIAWLAEARAFELQRLAFELQRS